MTKQGNYPFRCGVTEEQVAASRASVAPMSTMVGQAMQEAGPDAVLIAWMSDLHVQTWRDYGDTILSIFGTCIDSWATLRLMLEELAQLEPRPSLLLLGGDLSNNVCNTDDYLEEYSELKQLLDEYLPGDIPTLAALGNHDHTLPDLSPAFWQHFAGWRHEDWPEPVEPADYYYSTERLGWRIIVLDTRAGGPMRPMPERQYRWLESELQDDETPTVIMMHRPYITCENWVDDHRFGDERVMELITNSRAVRYVFSGHTHKAIAKRVGHQIHYIMPAVAYGIDDYTGWGCIVLSKHQEPKVIIKQAAIQLRPPEDIEPRPVRVLEVQESN